MTKNDIEQQIIYLDSRIDDLNKVIDLLKEIKHPEECPGYVVICSAAELNIRIKNMDELHQARKFLRDEFGSWKDELSTIWVVSGAHASWYGKIGEVRICIWLSCDPGDFPEQLKKDGCSFQMVSREELAYVCEKRNG